MRHGQIKINQELSDTDLQEIKENLMRFNQYHLKNVEFKGGILKIEIEDKWTLYPIPMITESGNYHNRGFLIYDDNFMGTLGSFASGISWSNSVFNGLAYFQDESFFTPDTGIKLLFMRKSDYVEFKRSNAIISHFGSRNDTIMITPNYLYKNHVFKAGPIYINKYISDNDSVATLKDSSKGIFFRHHLNAFQTLEVMYKGIITTYDLYVLKSQSGKWIYRNEGDVAWSIPVYGNFINLGLHGHYINDKTFLFAKNLGGDEGHRGYDKASFPASRNIGFLAQYQQQLYQKIFIAPFYEYNSSKLTAPILRGATINENTLGVGLRYYFTKISIPAVILDFARNIEDKSNHFHINIGVSI